jgi:hypothetical protein
VLLGEPPSGTQGLDAPPGPLAPHQPDRAAEARHIDQDHVTAAMTGRENPTGSAAHHLGSGLDHHPDAAMPLSHLENMEPVEADEKITTVAVGRMRTRARAITRRRLGHVETFRTGSLVATDPERPRPLLGVKHSRRVAHTPTSSKKRPITGPSPLLRAGPPLCLVSVLCPSRFPPLGVLPPAGPVAAQAHPHQDGHKTTGSPVPCQRLRARATYTPDTAKTARRPPPGPGHATNDAPSSRGYLTTPVSMPSFYSFDASAVVHTRSSSRRTPDPLTAGLFPQRSPPRLLTDAACGGLSAPPARRTRRANPHHRHSTYRSDDPLHRHHSTSGHTQVEVAKYPRLQSVTFDGIGSFDDNEELSGLRLRSFLGMGKVFLQPEVVQSLSHAAISTLKIPRSPAGRN